VRNTSTGVEKTGGTLVRKHLTEKHRHGRGEDCSALSRINKFSETPPRAWRRQFFTIAVSNVARNTSTGVEKTARVMPWTLSAQKHLHGRGEDP